MPTQKIYQQFLRAKEAGRKQLAVLIDPDKAQNLPELIALSIELGIDFFFIGGSLLLNPGLDALLEQLRRESKIPTVLFPGSSRQLSYRADAILFLSLISGRNAELLIGKHVEVAPFLKASPLEVLPTGYMLIDGGKPSSVSYMSNTNPIPADKTDIALCTALAGEMLGLRLLYMDAGSGALQPIAPNMIEAISQAIDIPLIIGGGIRSAEAAQAAFDAGADVLVVGNALEQSPQLLRDIAATRF